MREQSPAKNSNHTIWRKAYFKASKLLVLYSQSLAWKGAYWKFFRDNFSTYSVIAEGANIEPWTDILCESNDSLPKVHEQYLEQYSAPQILKKIFLDFFSMLSLGIFHLSDFGNRATFSQSRLRMTFITPQTPTLESSRSRYWKDFDNIFPIVGDHYIGVDFHKSFRHSLGKKQFKCLHNFLDFSENFAIILMTIKYFISFLTSCLVGERHKKYVFYNMLPASRIYRIMLAEKVIHKPGFNNIKTIDLLFEGQIEQIALFKAKFSGRVQLNIFNPSEAPYMHFYFDNFFEWVANAVGSENVRIFVRSPFAKNRLLNTLGSLGGNVTLIKEMHLHPLNSVTRTSRGSPSIVTVLFCGSEDAFEYDTDVEDLRNFILTPMCESAKVELVLRPHPNISPKAEFGLSLDNQANQINPVRLLFSHNTSGYFPMLFSVPIGILQTRSRYNKSPYLGCENVRYITNVDDFWRWVMGDT